jgi:hypothetical protein
MANVSLALAGIGRSPLFDPLVGFSIPRQGRVIG